MRLRTWRYWDRLKDFLVPKPKRTTRQTDHNSLNSDKKRSPPDDFQLEEQEKIRQHLEDSYQAHKEMVLGAASSLGLLEKKALTGEGLWHGEEERTLRSSEQDPSLFIDSYDHKSSSDVVQGISFANLDRYLDDLGTTTQIENQELLGAIRREIKRFASAQAEKDNVLRFVDEIGNQQSFVVFLCKKNGTESLDVGFATLTASVKFQPRSPPDDFQLAHKETIRPSPKRRKNYNYIFFTTLLVLGVLFSFKFYNENVIEVCQVYMKSKILEGLRRLGVLQSLNYVD